MPKVTRRRRGDSAYLLDRLKAIDVGGAKMRARADSGSDQKSEDDVEHDREDHGHDEG
jgi:hypothetical protein